MGLFVSIGVIVTTRLSVGEEAFGVWGWRIPFLLSILLVLFSYVLRHKMQESPLFARVKASGKASRTPIKDAFGDPENRRWALLALFGATAGQGVIWYTGQFYALYFLQTVLKINFLTSNYIVAGALLAATPFFIVFGSLSDRLGRKRIMLTGMALAVVCYYPIYRAMVAVSGFDPAQPTVPPVDPNTLLLGLLVFAQVMFVTMVYGPIAAFLVELFPTRIRYTSMSVPYHIGNGVFGGLVPFIGTALVSATGNMYAGIVYPIIIAAITFVIGCLYLTETKDRLLTDDHADKAAV